MRFRTGLTALMTLAARLGVAHAQDARAVDPDHERKSLSAETTFNSDISDRGALEDELWPLCERVARKMRTGAIWINGGFDFHAPFGGYKRSGNGREWGEYGFHEYLEIKSIIG